MGQPDKKALEGPLKDIAQFLTVLDENLSDKKWVAGELRIADFAVCEHIRLSERFEHFP